MTKKTEEMNPYSPVNLPELSQDNSWIPPVFVAVIIFLSIWWTG